MQTNSNSVCIPMAKDSARCSSNLLNEALRHAYVQVSNTKRIHVSAEYHLSLNWIAGLVVEKSDCTIVQTAWINILLYCNPAVMYIASRATTTIVIQSMSDPISSAINPATVMSRRPCTEINQSTEAVRRPCTIITRLNNLKLAGVMEHSSPSSPRQSCSDLIAVGVSARFIQVLIESCGTRTRNMSLNLSTLLWGTLLGPQHL